jgi:hemerythrin-like domain-containing protein
MTLTITTMSTTTLSIMTEHNDAQPILRAITQSITTMHNDTQASDTEIMSQ